MGDPHFNGRPQDQIVKEDSDHRIIPQAIGLIAGRTAQEYNHTID
jgi:hypothetical protein